jgi:cob(I)alamin adenosyltransferase
MTRIYTKTGDQGETSLFGGGRVGKDDARVDAYGGVDELNASLGLARSLSLPPDLDPVCQRLQDELFTVGAVLATPRGSKADAAIPHVRPEWIDAMERQIDAWDEELPPLTSFILPGGSQAASALHVARTLCRRAERRVVPLVREGLFDVQVVVYLNRLSDLLFAMARVANLRAQVPDVAWKPKKD